MSRCSKVFLVLTLLTLGDLACASDSTLIDKICSLDCSGKLAAVYRWRDSVNVVKIYEYQGDLRSCSHPPLIFLDPQGNPLLTIPEEPLNPADGAQAARFKALHQKKQALLKDLLKEKPTYCPERKKQP